MIQSHKGVRYNSCFCYRVPKRSWEMYIPQNMWQVTTYLLPELICTTTLTVKPDTLSSEWSALLTPWTTWNQALLGWKPSSIPRHQNWNTKNVNMITSIEGTVNTFHDWDFLNSVQVCLWTLAFINQKATLFKMLLARPLRNSYIYIPYCSQHIKQFDSAAK